MADGVRGPAELTEWERLAQLLAEAPSGAVTTRTSTTSYGTEFAADAFQALRELGTLEQTEPRTRDEAVRDELTRRADGYVRADVDAWLAHAPVAHRRHYCDPAPAREPPAF